MSWALRAAVPHLVGFNCVAQLSVFPLIWHSALSDAPPCYRCMGSGWRDQDPYSGLLPALEAAWGDVSITLILVPRI